jgi:hypothetical protein
MIRLAVDEPANALNFPNNGEVSVPIGWPKFTRFNTFWAEASKVRLYRRLFLLCLGWCFYPYYYGWISPLLRVDFSEPKAKVIARCKLAVNRPGPEP